jgi:vacuolar-type H+-ATPase subunit H
LALDRQFIEKRDFPIGRRGYEPDAVDAHLATVAVEVDALQRSGGRRGDSLAGSASAQVQAIVEAAESSAAEIEREARDEAAQIRQDAARDAQRTRDEAVQRSQEHVSKVHEATALMLQRVDAMESELTTLVESLRTGANRLTADLSLLEGNMGDLQTAAGQGFEPAPAPAPVPVPPPAPEPLAPPEPQPEPAASVPPAPSAPAPSVFESAAPEPFVPEPSPAADLEPAPSVASAEEDLEGARLIALNMALNGQSRDETDRYLAENFDLLDREALLDEVYATVEG